MLGASASGGVRCAHRHPTSGWLAIWCGRREWKVGVPVFSRSSLSDQTGKSTLPLFCSLPIPVVVPGFRSACSVRTIEWRANSRRQCAPICDTVIHQRDITDLPAQNDARIDAFFAQCGLRDEQQAPRARQPASVFFGYQLQCRLQGVLQSLPDSDVSIKCFFSLLIHEILRHSFLRNQGRPSRSRQTQAPTAPIPHLSFPLSYPCVPLAVSPLRASAYKPP